MTKTEEELAKRYGPPTENSPKEPSLSERIRALATANLGHDPFETANHEREPHGIEEIEAEFLNHYIQEVRKRRKTMQELDPGYIRTIAGYISQIERFSISGEQTEHPWLWLTGYVGNGKTTTARAIQRTFATITGDISRFKMYDAKELAELRELKDQFSYNKVKQCPYLIIDDMGIDIDYGHNGRAIAEIIFDRDKGDIPPTIITTNLTREQIHKHYGPRTLDRMNGNSLKLVFSNKSFRN